MINYVNDEGLAAAAAEIKSRVGSGSASAGGLQIEKYVDEQVSRDVSVSTLPYNFANGSAVVLNNEIHILGSIYYDSGYLYAKKYYKFDGSSWMDVRALPYEFHSGSAVVLNDAVHILGGGGNSYNTNHYLVGLDCRHIATMLPKGVHILLSDNEDIIYASNAKRISSNIAEVTDTGYVELFAALTDADNIKGYLTFY